jgi:hypothetical protein
LNRSAILVAALLAAGLLFDVPFAGSSPGRLGQETFAQFSGGLIYLRDGGLWRLDLTSQEQRPLVSLSAGTVTHAAYAPDRGRLAYSVVYRNPAYQVLGAEIVVADADGSNPRVVAEEWGTGFSVGWPTWPHATDHLVYTKRNVREGSQRVEEVHLATGARSVVVEAGSSPAASPSAPLVAYQTFVAQRYNILFFDRGAGTHTEVVDARWFEDTDDPAFSPDGATLAFVAAGAGPLPTGRTRPGVAHAHDLPGVFFDLWTVGADGSNLQRLAQLFDSMPYIAWSPTGHHLAAWGLFDLQIVDVTTGAIRSLGRTTGGGPISWGN